MDFGLGIGYNAEPKSAPSHVAPSRSVAVNSLKTGIKAQFQSSFVAASSGSLNAGLSNSSGMQAGNRVLRGFVSGGSIGGGVHAPPVNSSLVQSGPRSSESKENSSLKNSER